LILPLSAIPLPLTNQGGDFSSPFSIEKAVEKGVENDFSVKNERAKNNRNPQSPDLQYPVVSC
jgi:hypothetical protein